MTKEEALFTTVFKNKQGEAVLKNLEQYILGTERLDKFASTQDNALIREGARVLLNYIYYQSNPKKK